MLLPIRTDVSLRSTPWVNWGIIALNIVLYLITSRYPQLVAMARLNPRDPSILSYFTYSFVHAGGLHLLGNMLFLFIFGNNLNDRMGHVGYLGFYLAGAVFAGVGYAVTELHSVIGASGAVAAITGAFLVLFPRSNITISYFVGSFELRSIWVMSAFVLIDLLQNLAGDTTSIAHMAHLAGMLFGVVVASAMLVGNLLERDPFDGLALIQRWHRRRVYRDVVSGGYDPFAWRPRAPERLPAPGDAKAQQLQELRAEISESLAHHNHPHAALLFMELKQLDPKQVLSRQAQLEVANQLAAQQLYVEAAEAYEEFIAHYRNFEQIEQVELMLGLIYSRYLKRYVQAKELLLRALARLHGEREIELARGELKRAEEMLADPRTVR